MKGVVFFLILVSAFSFFLYTHNLINFPPSVHCDEVAPAISGQKILTGEIRNLFSVSWSGIPNISFLPHALSSAVFGNNIFALRFPSVAIGVSSLIFFFLLVSYLFGRRVAYISTVLFASSHWWIASARSGVINIQSVLPQILSFYFLFLGISKKKPQYFVLSGLSIGLGLYTYVNFRVIPVIIAGLFIYQLLVSEKKWWFVKNFIILSVSACFLFAPMIHYYRHQPIHTFLARSYFTFIFSPDKGTQAHMLSVYKTTDKKIWLAGNIKKAINLTNNNQDNSTQYGYQGRVLELITLLLLLFGQIVSLVRIKKIEYFFLLFWFWTTYIALGVFTVSVPFLPRLVGLLPVVYILASVALETLFLLIMKKFKFLGPKIRKSFAFLLIFTIIPIIAFKNIKIYFIDNPKSHLWLFAKNLEVELPKTVYQETIGNDHYQIVFVPNLYFGRDMCLFRFLFPEERFSLLEAKETPPKITGRGLFVVKKGYEGILKTIVSEYPRGNFINMSEEAYIYKTAE